VVVRISGDIGRLLQQERKRRRKRPKKIKNMLPKKK
jgi:hypothetical protein